MAAAAPLQGTAAPAAVGGLVEEQNGGGALALESRVVLFRGHPLHKSRCILRGERVTKFTSSVTAGGDLLAYKDARPELLCGRCLAEGHHEAVPGVSTS